MKSIADHHPWLSQRWETDTRYYRVILQPDVWQNWVITRMWGGRGTLLGRVVHEPVESYEVGLKIVEQIGKLRKRHGYRLVMEHLD